MSNGKKLDILVVSDDRNVRNFAMVALSEGGEGIDAMVKRWPEPLTATFHNVEPTAPRLLEVMGKINPAFQNLVPMSDAVGAMSDAVDARAETEGLTVAIVKKITAANNLIINAHQTDSEPQKRWYLDQALQKLNGQLYPDVIEGVKEQNLKDGVIDLDDAKFWEWDKGMAP